MSYFYPLHVLFPAGVHSWCWVRRQETWEKGHQASPGSQWTAAGPCGYRDRRHSIYHNTIATAWGQWNMGLPDMFLHVYTSGNMWTGISVCVSSFQVVFVYAWLVFHIAWHTVPPQISNDQWFKELVQCNFILWIYSNSDLSDMNNKMTTSCCYGNSI